MFLFLYSNHTFDFFHNKNFLQKHQTGIGINDESAAENLQEKRLLNNYVSLRPTHKPPRIRSRGFVCIVADTLRVHYAGVAEASAGADWGEGGGGQRG